jgi:PPP family 3-phenylpropionic acid transporter
MKAPVSLRLAFFYAAAFLLVGVQLPFWPVWLSERGLDAREIGLIAAAPLWLKAASNPFAGAVADRLGRKRVIVALAAGALLAYALFLPRTGFWTYLALSLVAGTCYSGVLLLGDNVAITLSYARGLDYGRIRVWGSVTFIIAAVGAGQWIALATPEVILGLVIGAAALICLASLLLPLPPQAAGARPRSPLHLVGERNMLLFLAAGTLVQASHAVYYAFGTLHWRGLGLSSGVIGALWAEGVAAEIVLFALSRRLVARLSPPLLIALGGAAGVLRWCVTAYAEALPWLVAVQLLHAFTFAAAHLGAMHYIARAVPRESSATGQALYSACQSGIGFGLGLLAAGALFEAYAGLAYLPMAGMCAAGALAASLLALRWRPLLPSPAAPDKPRPA